MRRVEGLLGLLLRVVVVLKTEITCWRVSAQLARYQVETCLPPMVAFMVVLKMGDFDRVLLVMLCGGAQAEEVESDL